ncbi:hypothetical protein MMC22_006948 [Lobaria immixta]|nr:hypothetical protein [Lobaria immixta]
MTSFISFHALKVFKTPAVLPRMTENGTARHSLINIFPPNLETLHLTRFQASSESVVEALEHLLAQKSPRHIPSLKKLILEETNSFDPFLRGRFGFGPANLMDGLWKGAQKSATANLGKVAAAQDVTIELIEKLTDEESTNDEFSGEGWEAGGNERIHR